MEKKSIGLVEKVGAAGILLGVLRLLLILFVVGFNGCIFLLLLWGLLLSLYVFEWTLMNMLGISLSFPIISLILLLFIQFLLFDLRILSLLLRLTDLASFKQKRSCHNSCIH